MNENHALQLPLGDIFRLMGSLGEAFGAGVARGMTPALPPHRRLSVAPNEPPAKRTRKMKFRGCSVKWCRGKHQAKTLCGKHYIAARRLITQAKAAQ